MGGVIITALNEETRRWMVLIALDFLKNQVPLIKLQDTARQIFGSWSDCVVGGEAGVKFISWNVVFTEMEDRLLNKMDLSGFKVTVWDSLRVWLSERPYVVVDIAEGV